MSASDARIFQIGVSNIDRFSAGGTCATIPEGSSSSVQLDLLLAPTVKTRRPFNGKFFKTV